MDIYRVVIRFADERKPYLVYCGYNRKKARREFHSETMFDGPKRTTVLQVISDSGTEDFAMDTIRGER